MFNIKVKLITYNDITSSI